MKLIPTTTEEQIKELYFLVCILALFNVLTAIAVLCNQTGFDLGNWLASL